MLLQGLLELLLTLSYFEYLEKVLTTANPAGGSCKTLVLLVSFALHLLLGCRCAGKPGFTDFIQYD